MVNENYLQERRILLKESTIGELSKFGVDDASKISDISSTLIPSDFSIRKEMTPARNQGTQGSCASFGVLSCLENIHKRDLSEAQVQHEAEKKYDDCTEGLAAVHSFEICKSKGVVDEKYWPFDDQQICWKSPPKISGKPRYKFSKYGYIYQRNRPVLLNLLANGSKGPIGLPTAAPGLPLTIKIRSQLFGRRRPVCASVPVIEDSWPLDGDVQMPSPTVLGNYIENMALPEGTGWHAIAICGWVSSSGRFIFKNSWGTFWGDQGYGTIPYHYIDAFSDLALMGW